MYIDFCSRPGRLVNNLLSIVKLLPIWKPSIMDLASRPVAAKAALVIPSGEQLFPSLTPGPNNFVVEPKAREQDFIVRLGGKRLDPGEYILNYIVPNLSILFNESLLPEIAWLLERILNHSDPRFATKFFMSRLIPDRTGRLRYGWELYDDRVAIFAASFMGDDSAFPHPIIRLLNLRRLGLS